MTLEEQIEIACLMEATARKPGNVHCTSAFDDLCYQDFVLAASAVAKPLVQARTVRLGSAILDAVTATRAATGTNVNLGIVLLLAPLVAVPEDYPLEQGIAQILNHTTIEDAARVYSAIRIAQPGGMGQASEQDIREIPTVTLRDAMALAADRDRIAEQYVTDFALVFEARTKLCELFASTANWESAIVTLHVWMLSRWPDTLISRKCGAAIANESSARAAKVLASADQNGKLQDTSLEEFDNWLRADGHRRNPGTTADLIAATLFAAIRDNLIASPSREQLQQFAELAVAGSKSAKG